MKTLAVLVLKILIGILLGLPTTLFSIAIVVGISQIQELSETLSSTLLLVTICICIILSVTIVITSRTLMDSIYNCLIVFTAPTILFISILFIEILINTELLSQILQFSSNLFLSELIKHYFILTYGCIAILSQLILIYLMIREQKI